MFVCSVTAASIPGMAFNAPCDDRRRHHSCSLLTGRYCVWMEMKGGCTFAFSGTEELGVSQLPSGHRQVSGIVVWRLGPSGAWFLDHPKLIQRAAQVGINERRFLVKDLGRPGIELEEFNSTRSFNLSSFPIWEALHHPLSVVVFVSVVVCLFDDTHQGAL